MAKKRLTVAFIKSASAPPGIYGDDHGLRLRVMPSGSRQWIWRGTVAGKRCDLGLGSPPYVGLAEARETAFEYRRLARRGGDPASLRQRPTLPTFAEAVEAAIEVQRLSWKDGGRQEAIWRSRLDCYAMPRLGRLRVDRVTVADVMAVLLPIWQDKHETARRVRFMLSACFKWAISQGHRQDNPADTVTAALPKPARVAKHHKALPHGEVAAALDKMKASKRAWWATKACLQFVIGTACRSIEARGAVWSEIDLEAREWRVPASRMKAKRDHVFPLNDLALAALQEAADMADGSALVFPSQTGRTLSDSTMSKLLRENGIEAVPHGFRSSFRDWAGETGVAREVAEACLAHVVANRTEAAYARSDLLARRVGVMDAWGRYLTGEAGEVIPFRERRA